MTAIDRLVEFIPLDAVDDAQLDDLLHSLATLDIPTEKSFIRGVLSMGLRAVEAFVLSDPALLLLAEYWDARIGDADRVIDERLLALTGSQSASLRAYIKRSLYSISREWRNEAGIPVAVFERLIERQATQNLGAELRCELCGYWFQSTDVEGADRQAAIARVGCVFANSPHPNRIGDPIKPLGFGKARFTTLTLDHKIPRLGFGSVEFDNIRVVCRFCNQGKMSYRRSHEALSPIIAGALSLVPPRVPHSQLRQLTFTSSVWHQGSCRLCGGTPRHAELTISVRRGAASWLVPWNVDVVCYDCL
ncbi:MAG: hypothetical protein JWP01_2527 [Myxococcales bacterium]|nr:hypothetical protein [Myxococcales bacterium]